MRARVIENFFIVLLQLEIGAPAQAHAVGCGHGFFLAAPLQPLLDQNEKFWSTRSPLVTSTCRVPTVPVVLVAWMLYLPAAALSAVSGIGSVAW